MQSGPKSVTAEDKLRIVKAFLENVLPKNVEIKEGDMLLVMDFEFAPDQKKREAIAVLEREDIPFENYDDLVSIHPTDMADNHPLLSEISSRSPTVSPFQPIMAEEPESFQTEQAEQKPEAQSDLQQQPQDQAQQNEQLSREAILCERLLNICSFLLQTFDPDNVYMKSWFTLTVLRVHLEQFNRGIFRMLKSRHYDSTPDTAGVNYLDNFIESVKDLDSNPKRMEAMMIKFPMLLQVLEDNIGLLEDACDDFNQFYRENKHEKRPALHVYSYDVKLDQLKLIKNLISHFDEPIPTLRLKLSAENIILSIDKNISNYSKYLEIFVNLLLRSAPPDVDLEGIQVNDNQVSIDRQTLLTTLSYGNNVSDASKRLEEMIDQYAADVADQIQSPPRP